MRIIVLGAKLEEITKEAYRERKKLSAVFLANEKEAQEALELANISYDGEIDLLQIEFCKVETQQECLAGSLRIPRLSDVCGSKFRILFFINSRNIVLIDNSEFSERVIWRIKQSRTSQGQTRERFLYNYFSQFMNRDLEYLGRYEKRIMQMEEDVMDGKLEDFQDTMMPVRKELLVLREYYDELRDLGKELEENENHFFSRKNLKYFGTITDRADRLMGRAMHLLDYIGQVRETYQEQVAEQQNKNMQFLTVVSTIFFPLTLITGWYGMNFKNMPELENGYPGVIGISLVVVVIIIWIFKKKKIF